MSSPSQRPHAHVWSEPSTSHHRYRDDIRADAGRPSSRGEINRRADGRVTIAGIGLGSAIGMGMLVGSTVLLLVVSVIVLAGALIAPFVGVVALTFLGPFPRPLIIPTPGLYAVLVGAILLGLVFRLPIDRPRTWTLPLPVVLLGAFFLYVTVQVGGAILGGPGGPRTLEITQLYAQLATAVLAFAVASVALSQRSPYPVVAAVLSSAVVMSGLAIAQWFRVRGPLEPLLNERAYELGRMTGPFYDPNYFGSFLAIAVTLAVAIATIVGRRYLRAVLILLAGFISVGLVLSQSRGALLALVAGLVTVAFVRSRKLGITVVLTMVLVAVVAYPAFEEFRFGAGGDRAGVGLDPRDDESGRISAALAGQEIFMSSPIFGIGFGRFVEESSVGLVAHNWYVSVMGELGISGAVLWTLFIIAMVLALRHRPAAARTVGFSLLIAWMVASVTLEVPTAYQVTGPVLITLAAAMVGRWSGGEEPQESHQEAHPARRPRVSVPGTLPQRAGRGGL